MIKKLIGIIVAVAVVVIIVVAAIRRDNFQSMVRRDELLNGVEPAAEPRARYSVKVGVAYGSDVEKVRDILLECATSNRRILKKPEPYVLFQDFGASSLDFELRFYVSDIWNGWNAPSDIRFEINRRFKDEGIEIPFPQMVVHQGSVVSEETQSQFYAAKKGKK